MLPGTRVSTGGSQQEGRLAPHILWSPEGPPPTGATEKPLMGGRAPTRLRPVCVLLGPCAWRASADLCLEAREKG